MAAPYVAQSDSTPLRITDYDIAGRPSPGDLAKFSAPLSEVLTDELDEAQRILGIPTEEIVLAALGRTIARTIGEGYVAVDFTGGEHSASALALHCAAPERASASEMLVSVHRELSAAPRRAHEQPAEVLISYRGSAPELACFDHALEIRFYRDGGLMYLDWQYDSRQFASYTVEELTEQFPFALIELTSEATPALLGKTDVAIAVGAFGR
ncbi:hypothetical protein [Mycolicibacterium komossense]|uniref:Polyketide synthase n=1 Tax=Mycolicibacterium komossense TaxID=1779 RepID=A0ABT3CBJ2_9MYCO|nr:hypothetical protein [Mycolicibacterium komossense]MCV7226806.1 hypothetical protein [Mycolicibacterium komossense]